MDVEDLTITIRVNGKTQTVAAPLTLTQLLAELAITDRRVAIELNGEVVPRSEHGRMQLSDGDQVEIIRAIGGG